MTSKKTGYLGNPNLKRANVQIEFTPEQIEQYARCMKDPVYFIEKSAFSGSNFRYKVLSVNTKKKYTS